jgi:phage repressor protein C with HTH and peptisase S24 domain
MKTFSSRDVLNRLKTALHASTDNELANMLGVSKATISNWGSRNSIDLPLVFSFCKQVNIDWLITGEGSMEKTTTAADDRPSLESDTHLAHIADTSEGIPLIPFEAMAGAFTGELSAMDYECQRLVIPGVRADYVIAIGGDSMRPNFHSGDMVACSVVSLSDIFFQWGRVYIIDTAQGPLLKRVRPGSSPATVTLISDNPDYAPFEVERTDIYHIALVRALVRIE